METVGIYLKREREACKISLRDVAQITKITGIYLEHIEKNEFDKIPQGPYIKGYLSSYSRAIGCDVNHTIRLYESANRQGSQAEADPSTIESIDAGQVSATSFEAPSQAPSSQPRWGNRGLWLSKFVPVFVGRGGSIKASKKPIETSETTLTIVRKSFQRLNERLQQTGFSATIVHWSTHPRRWIYASAAISGAVIVFLAATGFYHLFLFDPGSAIVAEAETTASKAPLRASEVGFRSPTETSARTDTSMAAESSPDHVTAKVLSVTTASVPTVSGAKPDADAEHTTSEPAEQFVATSSAKSSATDRAALLHQGSDASAADLSGNQPAEKDASPKQTTADASIKVLKATIGRSIENRMPVGADQSFAPSDEKIYVWSMVASRQSPSTIHHIYYFEGKKISDVSLDVRSSRWRTWSSKTIADNRYRGNWRVDITASNGDLLKRLFFEVK